MHVAEYTYHLHKGHPLVCLGGKPYLLATGAPRSVGNAPIVLERRDIDPKPSSLGVTVARLRNRLGGELAGMLGCDLLTQYTVNLFPENRLLRFTESEPVGDIAVPLALVEGVPVVNVEVGGRFLKLVLDTSSAISLLPEAVVHCCELEGRNLAYHPISGSFHTLHYMLKMAVGGETRRFRIGIVPDSLADVLVQHSLDGILGYDLLEHFGMSLSISDKVLRLGRRGLASSPQRSRASVARLAMS